MLLSDEYEYRHLLLRVLLIITILFVSFFSVVNWMAGYKTYALIEAAVVFQWIVILSIVKTTRYLQQCSFVYLLSAYCIILLGISHTSFRTGLFAWILIFPILSYLLLGRRAGMQITTVGLLGGLGIIGWRVWRQDPEVHWIALANFGFCAIAIWTMAHIYESKREIVVGRLQIMAAKDPLTGLLNVRTLTQTLTYVLQNAKQCSQPVTIVYIDINDFKAINDIQGHQRGNEILIIVAKAIKSVTRLEDYPFRYGGDEFCIILTNCAIDQAKSIFGRRLSDELHNNEKDLSLSIGYAQTGESDYLSPDLLLHQADQSMYAEKRASKLKSKIN
ncbi:GGDEF domain-containing protein [Psychromonas ossibalaenae]|uniref:GGDEF domain-containing protein n=1 Tax=Psychromonas ossibalaenae TaxID=444922 RepID=UPI000364B3DE|nr:GGDEF domain-containing protein [Psychromonas ossibalaenae]